MTTQVPRLTAPPSRPRRTWSAAWAVLAAVGACLLAAGCSSGGASAGGTMTGHSLANNAAAPAAPPGHVPGASGVHAAGSGAAARSAGLTALRLPGQAVIFTATLSLSAPNVQATVARATQLTEAAGGYVSGEHASVVQAGKHAAPVVNIQFKVPAAVYQSTLGALAGLGTRRSETQQALDVTGTVADVNSRVASAEAAIAQLRKLLTRAGTVGGLLTVQEQINAEEATLEALQSQQRALARETSYATITMTVIGPPPPPALRNHPHLAAAGFLGGLVAGWRALRAVVAVLLTLAGAMLPFVIPLGLIALAAAAARRWLSRRRSASARPAD